MTITARQVDYGQYYSGYKQQWNSRFAEMYLFVSKTAILYNRNLSSKFRTDTVIRKTSFVPKIETKFMFCSFNCQCDGESQISLKCSFLSLESVPIYSYCLKSAINEAPSPDNTCSMAALY